MHEYARLCTYECFGPWRPPKSLMLTDVRRVWEPNLFFSGSPVKNTLIGHNRTFFSHFFPLLGFSLVVVLYPVPMIRFRFAAAQWLQTNQARPGTEGNRGNLSHLSWGETIHVIDPSNYGLMSTYSRNRASKCIVNLWASEASMDDVKMDFVPLSVALR